MKSCFEGGLKLTQHFRLRRGEEAEAGWWSAGVGGVAAAGEDVKYGDNTMMH